MKYTVIIKKLYKYVVDADNEDEAIDNAYEALGECPGRQPDYIIEDTPSIFLIYSDSNGDEPGDYECFPATEKEIELADKADKG